MKAIFSIDVEEWFHLTDTETLSRDIEEWDLYPSRVEETFKELITILDKHNIKATCFFVGWIAEKYPELVSLAYKKGHEIGVHGYYHRLVFKQTYDEFYKEILKTKTLIEGIIDDKVYSFRAPSFSIESQNLWAYKILMELGFKYSSSIHPGKYKEFGLFPKVINYDKMKIIEIPLPILKFPFSSLSCFGGGYFRLFPLFWYNIAIKFIKNVPLTFYIHPRDIDLKHPNVKMPLKRKFKSLVNVKSTKKKIESILDKNDFAPLFEVIDELEKDKLQHTTLCISTNSVYSLSEHSVSD